jgi:ElaA protein
VQRALELVGDRPSRLDAQSPLAAWYTRFGYAQDGPEFVEDGIRHVPMHRP